MAKVRSDSPSDTNRNSEEDLPEDDFEVAEAIPMALTGQDFLAYVIDNLRPQIAGETLDSFATALQNDTSGDPQTTAYQLLPRASAGEARKFLKITQSLLSALTGKDGILQRFDTVAANRSEVMVLQIRNAAERPVQLYLESSVSDNLSIKMFRQEATSEKYIHVLSYEVNITNLGVKGSFSGMFDDDNQRFQVEGVFDQGNGFCEIAFLPHEALLDGPQKTVFRVTIDEPQNRLHAASVIDWSPSSGNIPGAPSSFERFVTNSLADFTGKAVQTLASRDPDMGLLNWLDTSAIQSVEGDAGWEDEVVVPNPIGDTDFGALNAEVTGQPQVFFDRLDTFVKKPPQLVNSASGESITSETIVDDFNPAATVRVGILGSLPDPVPPQ